MFTPEQHLFIIVPSQKEALGCYPAHTPIPTLLLETLPPTAMRRSR